MSERIAVPASCAGQRLDVVLARLAPGVTRARAQRLLEGGHVRVDGRAAKASVRLHGGEILELDPPPPEPSGLVAQDLPLTVLFEDEDLLVLDKAAGMVVHPARGTPHSTVVNALLHRLGEATAARSDAADDRRSGETAAGGTSAEPDVRLGLVHRLDKETSGCLVVAKTEAALAALQAQWKARGVEKVYLALCHGWLADEGRLDTPYGRHPRDRTRYTTRVRDATRRALTDWRVRERFPAGGGRRDAGATLVEVTLHTGRTHQIRVHLAEQGHPLVADAVYGGTRREARLPESDPLRVAATVIGRQALHAWRLGLDHPRTGRRLAFEAPIPADLEAGLRILRGSPMR